MVRKSGRSQKIGDQIQREISDLLHRELRDPRVGMVTITAVEMSPDCTHANVFYTCLDAAHAPQAAEGLRHAAGFLRSHLAKRIRLFSTPDLHFFYDESIERGARLSQLIDSLSRSDSH
ncbi:MAG: 30S ribosome-binding factor RbfA [Betaproteobacteria bacterium]|nr:30S ribosome-binding factor RbfA [Betaproteobacteria bacterium]